MAEVRAVVLDETTQSFLDGLMAANPPPLYTMTAAAARAVLEQLQAGGAIAEVSVEEKVIRGGDGREVALRLVRPRGGAAKRWPAVVYFHGGGWVLGSAATHEQLVAALALGAQAAVVFVNYSPSPEARYPTALEECYAATRHVAEHGAAWGLDVSRLAVAGDSAGGHLAIGVTLLSKERRAPLIDRQLLFYPVTSAVLDTPSYREYGEGPWLTRRAMEWFWDSYEPDRQRRRQPLLSPLHAPVEMLRGLPKALVITAECDVLRDEGERYAHRLMQAGVEVTALRLLGTIHDFAMLNALSQTPAARAALRQALAFLTQ